MANKDSLNRCVKNAIEDERQRVKKMRRNHPDVKHRITDYASVTVACGYKRSSNTFKGYSASPVGHKYTAKIKRRLEAYDTEKSLSRKKELEREFEMIQEALARYS